MTLLTLEHVARTFGANTAHPVHALRDVSFTVDAGEFVAIMGESGAGKSTLLNLLATLDQATAGQLRLQNQDLAQLSAEQAAKFRRDHLGFVFQSFNLLDSLTNRDNIFLPLVLKRTPLATMQAHLAPLAEQLGLQELLDRYPQEISGGQKQRVAIARALITQPALLLADEPTGALDSNTSQQILAIFNQVNAQGQTILMVTHSAVAASYAQRVLFVKDGRIYHELFRKEQSSAAMQSQINNAMLTLSKGGVANDD